MRYFEDARDVSWDSCSMRIIPALTSNLKTPELALEGGWGITPHFLKNLHRMKCPKGDF